VDVKFKPDVTYEQFLQYFLNLILQCRPRCWVRVFISSHRVGLDSPYSLECT